MPGRSIANDVDPASIIDAFTDVYRMLEPDTFCISFYGWNRMDAFFRAWRRAGFYPVGHIVWRKDSASSTGSCSKHHPCLAKLASSSRAIPIVRADLGGLVFTITIKDIADKTGYHRDPAKHCTRIHCRRAIENE